MIRYLILISLFVLQKGIANDRPNLLIMMSDDQSFPHASAYGSKMAFTPNFDRVANEGVLFTNAFCSAPGCSPSRAAFLTGRNIWQIEHAGTHASSFHKKYLTFMDLLKESGYHTGHTGKGWGPGNYSDGGRENNPAGPIYGSKKGNYSEGFSKFIKSKPKGSPFAFWFGSKDPHRSFEKGSGQKAGKTLDQADLPPFLPDSPTIRGDLLDYALEIERFDKDCGKMLEILKKNNLDNNTIIIITSDNGMAFPYAKANCTEYGIHMPLAISWKPKIPANQICKKLISFIDITATIHEAMSISAPKKFPIMGKSFLNSVSKLRDSAQDNNSPIYAGRERHSSSRYNSLGYPQRCIRTDEYLYIINFRPERWPAGPGQKFSGKPGSRLGPEHGGYHDIDACPTLSFMIAKQKDPKIAKYFHLAVNKRPKEQLFNIRKDPGCLNNLANDPKHAIIRDKLSQRLVKYLTDTNDPRALNGGDIFETYKRYSSIRWFPEPEWVKKNPESVPKTPWLRAKK